MLSTETEDGVLRIGVSTSERRDPVMTYPSNNTRLLISCFKQNPENYTGAKGGILT